MNEVSMRIEKFRSMPKVEDPPNPSLETPNYLNYSREFLAFSIRVFCENHGSHHEL